MSLQFVRLTFVLVVHVLSEEDLESNKLKSPTRRCDEQRAPEQIVTSGLLQLSFFVLLLLRSFMAVGIRVCCRFRDAYCSQ